MTRKYCDRIRRCATLFRWLSSYFARLIDRIYKKNVVIPVLAGSWSIRIFFFLPMPMTRGNKFLLCAIQLARWPLNLSININTISSFPPFFLILHPTCVLHTNGLSLPFAGNIVDDSRLEEKEKRQSWNVMLTFNLIMCSLTHRSWKLFNSTRFFGRLFVVFIVLETVYCSLELWCMQ